MITTARPISVKEILKNSKSDNAVSVWCGEGKVEMITHKSWISLLIIARWIKEKKGGEPTIAVPGFYCYDTIYQIENETDILYYDIDEDTFLPDYKKLSSMLGKRSIDMLLFVHYFGMELSMNDAKIFCKTNNILLVEDAVHVLYPYGKIGKVGDIVLYSPWKNIGLPDGALIEINSKGPSELDVYEVLESLKKQEKQFERVSPLNIQKWKGKKIVQKILPSRIRSFKENKDEGIAKEAPCGVSDYSKNKILNIAYTRLKQIGDIRRLNSLYIQEILKDSGSFEVIDNGSVPYALSVKSSDIEPLWDAMSPMGQICYQWPHLHPDIKKSEAEATLKKQILHIAVHDGVSLNRLHKKVSKAAADREPYRLTMSEVSKEKYVGLCKTVKRPLPLLQSVAYTDAKEKQQGWRAKYISVSKNGEVVAFFTVLTKYKLICRINRGPYCVSDKHEEEVIRIIKEQFGSKGKVLFFAPELEQNGKNISRLLDNGFKYRGQYFSTGYIDLGLSEEKLRKNLSSKWRNQLKSCEKLGMEIMHPQTNKEFEELLCLHKQDKEKRDYKDSGDEITRFLYNAGNMKVMYLNGDGGNVISLVMIALHHKTATYYIGWSNEEGYRKNANRFLLWETIRSLKSDGYEWFDLGGINMVETAGIAEFKLGTGCSHLNLVGEFSSI